jgi:hypothetical protein
VWLDSFTFYFLELLASVQMYVIKISIVRFQVLTAASMKIAVFWVVVPCSLVEVYRRFRGACCLQHQGDRTQDSHLHTCRRKNLKSHLVNLYGEATLCYIRRFEALQIKKAKRLCPLLIALMMEAASTSETSVKFYQTALRNIPEDRHL